MSDDIKKKIITELEERISRLKKHYYEDKIVVSDNQYEELNQALSKVIGVPLIKELESVIDFINKN